MVWTVAGAQDFILVTPLLGAAASCRHAFARWALHSSGAGGNVTRHEHRTLYELIHLLSWVNYATHSDLCAVLTRALQASRLKTSSSTSGA